GSRRLTPARGRGSIVRVVVAVVGDFPLQAAADAPAAGPLVLHASHEALLPVGDEVVAAVLVLDGAGRSVVRGGRVAEADHVRVVRAPAGVDQLRGLGDVH